MKFVDINGKLIRKEPKYYLQDVLDFPGYGSSYEKLEEFLENLEEEHEIHLVNTDVLPVHY